MTNGSIMVLFDERNDLSLDYYDSKGTFFILTVRYSNTVRDGKLSTEVKKEDTQRYIVEVVENEKLLSRSIDFIASLEIIKRN
ncbi:MAG: hypothetical protein WA941_16495 [Nitrososphaeraceae archaeon]